MSMFNEPNQREYKPIFNDDRDYSTNAPTYYDYLADINNSVQKAYEDISNLVEGDIIETIDSNDTELLEVTKKRINGKVVKYTLKPKEKDTTITGDTTHGLTVNKTDNHNFNITLDKKVITTFLEAGVGLKMEEGTDGTISLYVDSEKFQRVLNFSDGIKKVGSNNVSIDWNKVQKVLRPDNKSIIIDENGTISAQIPYDRLESKVDKWRTVGNVGGSIFKLAEDAQPTTVNPAFLKKTGTYFYLSRSKSDASVWGGKADTPTSTPGVIRVTSSNYNEFVLQEFFSMDGKNYFFRIGSNEQLQTDKTRNNFWAPWRAVFNEEMYKNGAFGENKGKYWGQGSQDSDLNYNAGAGTQRTVGKIVAGDLTTEFETVEKYNRKRKNMTDVIRFAYEAGSVAGDCHTGSNVYYRVNAINTVTQEAIITAHNAVNGTPITQFSIEHPFFANDVNDISVANDRIYFISDLRIFWWSLQDYSTGYIDFNHLGSNRTSNGVYSSYDRHLKLKGISYYNEKLYVMVQEDYKAIANDNNLGKDVLRFAIWEITLNTNGTGNVSDRCLFNYALTGVDMRYLQVINNYIHVGFNLDRLYNASAQSAYGQATSSNKYEPCGIGTLTLSMTGLMFEQNENVKQGLEINGLGHLYTPARQAENANELNADGCIVGYQDKLLVNGYADLIYTGVYAIDTYVNKWLPTVSFDSASRISYTSSGEAVVTSQVKNDETGETQTVVTQLPVIEERTVNPIVLE